jgi:hypothetical protein
LYEDYIINHKRKECDFPDAPSELNLKCNARIYAISGISAIEERLLSIISNSTHSRFYEALETFNFLSLDDDVFSAILKMKGTDNAIKEIVRQLGADLSDDLLEQIIVAICNFTDTEKLHTIVSAKTVKYFVDMLDSKSSAFLRQSASQIILHGFEKYVKLYNHVGTIPRVVKLLSDSNEETRFCALKILSFDAIVSVKMLLDEDALVHLRPLERSKDVEVKTLSSAIVKRLVDAKKAEQQAAKCAAKLIALENAEKMRKQTKNNKSSRCVIDAPAKSRSDEYDCVICLAEASCITCAPCGHTVMCKDCCERVESKNMPCPYCQETIESTVDWSSKGKVQLLAILVATVAAQQQQQQQQTTHTV